MLGKRGPQAGLFEADTLYGQFIGQDSFYGFLAQHRGELFRDEDFASLYTVTSGRPSVPPSLLATALILQTHDRVSDEEAKERADYDLRWKVALGVEVDARPFAKSTLQEFRAQLVVHQQQAAVFRRSLELAKQRGWLKRQRPLKVALDTTHILGRGAVKDTYNLLADGIVQVARVLARQAGQQLREWAEPAGFGRYVAASSLKGQAEIDWSNPTARRQFLGQVVADADRALELVRQALEALAQGSPEEQPLREAAGLLSRILLQDIERTATGPHLKRGVAKDRLVSVHDPQMRHGRKSARQRFDGYKAQVVADTDTQLVTAVTVLPGNAPDSAEALVVVEATETATETRVAEVIADAAYGDGATRQACADAGRTLVAKVPAVSNQGLLPKTAFVMDPQTGTCTCPAQQHTRDLRPHAAGGGVFVFAAEVCQACPLRKRCCRGPGGRTVQLHPQEALLQAARELQRSPACTEYRQRRQVIEHRLARLVQLGIRQARYLGSAKVLFQLCMAAAVANLVLLMNTHDSGADRAVTIAVASLAAVVAALHLVVYSRPFRHPLPLAAPIHALGSDFFATPRHPHFSVKTSHSRPGS